jgi:hypothetical protein
MRSRYRVHEPDSAHFIASTITALLGEDYRAAEPRTMEAIAGVFNR